MSTQSCSTPPTRSDELDDEDDMIVSLDTQIYRCPSGKNNQYTLTATITAEDFDDIQERRAPLDIICLVDTSKSMSGGISQPNRDKLQQVMSCFQNLLKFLGDEDRFTVYQFAQQTKKVIDMAFMNKENRFKCASILEKQMARPDGGTNLLNALQVALQDLTISTQEEEESNRSASIWIFSDGLDRDNRYEVNSVNPNLPAQQVTDKELDKRIKRLIQSYESKIKTGFTINTFGFGEEHDDLILASMAEYGHGSYFFISSNNTNKSPFIKYFADCLNRQLSSILQKGKTTAELQESRIIRQIHSSATSLTSSVVSIGEMYSGETMNVFYDFECDEPTIVGKLTFSFTDLVNGAIQQVISSEINEDAGMVEEMGEDLVEEYMKMKKFVDGTHKMKDRGLFNTTTGSLGKTNEKTNRARNQHNYSMLRTRSLQYATPTIRSNTTDATKKLKGKTNKAGLKKGPGVTYFTQKGIDAERAIRDPEFIDSMEQALDRILVSFLGTQNERYQQSLNSLEQNMRTSTDDFLDDMMQDMRKKCLFEWTSLFGELTTMLNEVRELKEGLVRDSVKSQEILNQLTTSANESPFTHLHANTLPDPIPRNNSLDGTCRDSLPDQNDASTIASDDQMRERGMPPGVNRIDNGVGDIIDFDELVSKEQDRIRRKESGWKSEIDRRRERELALQAELDGLKEQEQELEAEFQAKKTEIQTTVQERDKALQDEIKAAELRKAEREKKRVQMERKEQKEISQFNDVAQQFKKRQDERESLKNTLREQHNHEQEVLKQFRQNRRMGKRMALIHTLDSSQGLTSPAAKKTDTTRRTNTKVDYESLENAELETNEDSEGDLDENASRLTDAPGKKGTRVEKGRRGQAQRARTELQTIIHEEKEEDERGDQDNSEHSEIDKEQDEQADDRRDSFEDDDEPFDQNYIRPHSHVTRKQRRRRQNEDETEEEMDENENRQKARTTRRQAVENQSEERGDDENDEEDEEDENSDQAERTVKHRTLTRRGEDGDSAEEEEEDIRDRQLDDSGDDQESNASLEQHTSDSTFRQTQLSTQYNPPASPRLDNAATLDESFLREKTRPMTLKEEEDWGDDGQIIAAEEVEGSSFLFKLFDSCRYSTCCSVTFCVLFVIFIVFFVFLLIGGLSLLFGGRLMSWTGNLAPISTATTFAIGKTLKGSDTPRVQIWTGDSPQSNADERSLFAIGPKREVPQVSNRWSHRNGPLSNTTFVPLSSNEEAETKHLIEVGTDSVYIRSLQVGDMQIELNNIPDLITKSVRSQDVDYLDTPTTFLSPLNLTQRVDMNTKDISNVGDLTASTATIQSADFSDASARRLTSENAGITSLNIDTLTTNTTGSSSFRHHVTFDGDVTVTGNMKISMPISLADGRYYPAIYTQTFASIDRNTIYDFANVTMDFDSPEPSMFVIDVISISDSFNQEFVEIDNGDTIYHTSQNWLKFITEPAENGAVRISVALYEYGSSADKKHSFILSVYIHPKVHVEFCSPNTTDPAECLREYP
ncbi:hypothetical protein BLNAU_2402 [Blattamonas nauphoetae]|uniref:VWFA domain-containing protein n=1 Tax=Blattamonas nauphoetae TaxID=2049346 RepID=A0ABQ9YFX8_9EUKA|nr:hypothetical protein BLNAU_2402 [Blattamonas nauphoetae]